MVASASSCPPRVYEVIHAAKNCQDKTETLYTVSLSDNGKTRIGITHQVLWPLL